MKSLEELRRIRQDAKAQVNIRTEKDGARIVVGMATCGIASGARPVMKALLDENKRRSLDSVRITQTGCIGACKLEPIIEVYTRGGEKTTYVEMTEEKARKVINEHIVNGRIISEYTIGAYEK